MVTVFNEIIVSEVSAKDQLIQWKHDTRGISNFLKMFKAIFYSSEQLQPFSRK